jgi:hypothetical protein
MVFLEGRGCEDMSLGAFTAFTVVIVLFMHVVHSMFMNECDSSHVLFWQTMPDS